MMKLAIVLLFILSWGGTGLADPAVTLSGNFVQGGLLFGRTCVQCRVILQEREVLVSAIGNFIVGFDREAPADQELQVQTPAGTMIRKSITLQQRDYQIQRIDGVSQLMMHPSEEDLLRIRREAEELARVRQISTDYDYFLESFNWPLTGRITGVYGSQRIFNGELRRPHYGVDIVAPTGTPVKAPAGGVVTLTHPGMFFAGTTLVIDHGHGLSSTFLHLDNILVEVGQKITRGQIVAAVGATGRVTGPHLDWRINWFDQRLDPALLVGEMAD